MNIEKFKNTQQLEVFSAAIKAEERQKDLIARNLHDGVVPHLTLVKMHLARITKRPEAVKLAKDVDECIRLTSECASAIRQACYDLVPPTLSNLGLLKAIEHLLFDIRKTEVVSTNLTIEEAVKDVANRFLVETQVNVFRIMQELLNNILKHAKPEKINFSVSKTGQNMLFKIHYDGIGISSRQTSMLSKTGLGLNSISSRVLLIRGNIDYRASKDGNLTCLEVPIGSLQTAEKHL